MLLETYYNLCYPGDHNVYLILGLCFIFGLICGMILKSFLQTINKRRSHEE